MLDAVHLASACPDSKTLHVTHACKPNHTREAITCYLAIELQPTATVFRTAVVALTNLPARRVPTNGVSLLSRSAAELARPFPLPTALKSLHATTSDFFVKLQTYLDDFSSEAIPLVPSYAARIFSPFTSQMDDLRDHENEVA